MRRLSRALTAFLSAAALVAFPGVAIAATGQVTVFETEFTELTTYEHPGGCYKLPAAAHVLINQTNQPVTIYAGPACITTLLVVPPGYGAHVAPVSGSFSV